MKEILLVFSLFAAEPDGTIKIQLDAKPTAQCAKDRDAYKMKDDVDQFVLCLDGDFLTNVPNLMPNQGDNLEEDLNPDLMPFRE